jgi:hypothetical protein
MEMRPTVRTDGEKARKNDLRFRWGKKKRRWGEGQGEAPGAIWFPAIRGD